MNDYAGLEGVCFNIGWALLQAARRMHGDPDSCRLEAVRWLGLCEMICHRFGVGGQSDLCRLTLTEIAFDLDWSFADFALATAGIHDAFGSFEALLQDALKTAVDRGNRLEQAKACVLLARAHAQTPGKAKWFLDEAIAIYRELGREDKIAALHASNITPAITSENKS